MLGKPDVWGSIDRFDGQASIWWAKHGPCYRCVFPESYRCVFPESPSPGLVASCDEGGVLGVVCAAVGSIQAVEVVELIVGIGDPLVGRLMVHDALRQSWDILTVHQNPDCAVCGLSPTVTSLAGAGMGDGTVSGAVPVVVPRISALELADLLSGRGGSRRVRVVDVRGAQERTIAGIPGARAIHVDEFRSGAAVPQIPFDLPVVIFCRAGVRSQEAARILIEAGHPDVRSLQGGVLAWVRDVDPAQPRY